MTELGHGGQEREKVLHSRDISTVELEDLMTC